MKKEDLRIVFMGTPEFAVESLRALVEGGFQVVAVCTQPDKPVGRHGSQLQAPAVKQYALSKGIPVLQPVKMKDEAFIEQLRAYRADLQVVVAYRMLPEVVWAMPRYGTFNVHASLLPQYRGAAPINWAIINGETETGITTFMLDQQIDTGRMILQERFPIPDEANVEYVYDGLMHLGAQLCVQTVNLILESDGQMPTTAQAETPEQGALKPAPKIFKETCEINWAQPAKAVYDFIRGLSPYPGAWGEVVADAPLEVKVFATRKTALPCTAQPATLAADKHHLYVATADCWLEILELQIAGKRRMAAQDFLNGMRGKINSLEIS